MNDKYEEHVVDYFDTHTPEYSTERYDFIINTLKKRDTSDTSLLDVGCGVGNILEMVSKECGVKKLYGIDVGGKYVELTQKRIGCPVWQGSIVDEAFVDSLPHKFDFIIVGAVLHHLVSSTRGKSKQLAEKAIRNCLSLLNPNGYIFIHEPTFEPKFLMDVLFYVKAFVSRFTNQRIPLFGNTWNNIGAPIVSYYSVDELHKMVEATGGVIVDSQHGQYKMSNLYKKLHIKRLNSTFLVRRTK